MQAHARNQNGPIPFTLVYQFLVIGMLAKSCMQRYLVSHKKTSLAVLSGCSSSLISPGTATCHVFFPGEFSSTVEQLSTVMDQNVWDAEIRRMKTTCELSSEQTVGADADGDGTLTMLELVRKRLLICSEKLDLLKSAWGSNKVLVIGKNGNGKSTLLNKLVHECFEDAFQATAESLPYPQPVVRVFTTDVWECPLGGQPSRHFEPDKYELIFGHGSAVDMRAGVIADVKVSDAFHKAVDGKYTPNHEALRFSWPFLPTAVGQSTTATPCTICFGEDYEVILAYKSADRVAFILTRFHELLDELQRWDEDHNKTVAEDGDIADFVPTSKVRTTIHAVSVGRLCCYAPVGTAAKGPPTVPLGHCGGALRRGCKSSRLQDCVCRMQDECQRKARIADKDTAQGCCRSVFV